MSNKEFLYKCSLVEKCPKPLEEYKGHDVKIMWECLYCDNRTKFLCIPTSILNRYTKSCGCYNKQQTSKANTRNLLNQRFHRLIVIEKTNMRRNNCIVWKCRCDCGNICNVASLELVNSDTKSCGCLFYERFAGSNNPSWNPNLTQEDRADRRNLPEFRNWSSQVLQKYNYTCQCCNKRGGKLVAHHKDGYHWCKERRFDLTNGICLCEECHRSFHSIYGVKNNTECQFLEFQDITKSHPLFIDILFRR